MTTTIDRRRGAKCRLPPALPSTVRALGMPQIQGKIGQRNAEMLCLYYGLGHPARSTLAAIGTDYHVSRERVRQVIERALELLDVTA